MKRIVVPALIAGAFAIAPATAQADEDFFLVDTTSDSGALTACTGTAADCSLRGAFSNADDGDTGADTDSVVFDSTIFDGVETTPGDATVVLATGLGSDENLALGTSCSTTNPCAGIDGPAGENAIGVTGGSFSMNGVAIFGIGSAAGLFKAVLTGPMSLVNNYFGLKLDGSVGTSAVASAGIALSGGDAQIGGVGSTPNYFAGLGTGLSVFTADNVTVQGNVFGVLPNGTVTGNTTTDIDVRSNIVNDGPENITIGAPPNDSTQACDDGCNVIAGAGGASSSGIAFTSAGTDATTQNVSITGNHIGLDAAGTGATGTGRLIAIDTGDGVTVSGNHLAGGTVGVQSGSSGSSPVIENNSFGTNSSETAVVDGTGAASIDVVSSSTSPALIEGNLIAKALGESGAGILIGGVGATADENTIGLAGSAGSGGESGLVITSVAHTVEDNTVSETTGSAITLVDASGSSLFNNRIGADGPILGDGIAVFGDSGNSIGNVIGGLEPASANEFEDVAGDAIRIEGNGQDENEVRTNFGSAGGLFLDLEGDDGPGNGADGPNDGIDAPKLKKVRKEEVKGSGVPDAKVWVYRSRSDEGDVPSGLKKLVGSKTVKNDGTWKLKPDNKVKGKHVITALQTDDDGNSSELSKGKKPK